MDYYLFTVEQSVLQQIMIDKKIKGIGKQKKLSQ